MNEIIYRLRIGLPKDNYRTFTARIKWFLFGVSGGTLPTDTDIKTEAKKHAEWDDGTTYQSSMYGFETGAKWMRDKLK